MEKEAVAEIARMFGWEDAPRPPLRRRHDGQPRGAVGRRAARARARRSSRRRRRTTRTAASAACSASRSRTIPCDRRGRHGRRRARAAARAGRRRHGRRDAWARRRRARSIRSPRSWRCATRHGFRAARRRGLRRLLRPRGQPRRAGARAPSTGSARRTRSSSIRTSTASSPTAAAACSSAIRRSAASTSTTRPTRTSARPSCTWARSASSARGPGAARWRSGRRMRLLPLEPGGEFARRLRDSRAAALALHAKLAARRAVPAGLRARARHRRLGGRARASASAASALARGDLRRGRAARPAPRARRAARRLLRPRGRRHRARPRHGHLPALGADEARAPRVDGPDLGDPRRVGGGRRDERAERERPRPSGRAGRPRLRARDRRCASAAFGPPAWRTSDEIGEADARVLRAFFETPPEGAALLVAEARRRAARLHLPRDPARLLRRRGARPRRDPGRRPRRPRAAARAGALMRAAEAWARGARLPQADAERLRRQRARARRSTTTSDTARDAAAT